MHVVQIEGIFRVKKKRKKYETFIFCSETL